MRSLDPRTLTALGLELLRRAHTAPILNNTAKRRPRNGLFCALLAAFPARRLAAWLDAHERALEAGLFGPVAQPTATP